MMAAQSLQPMLIVIDSSGSMRQYNAGGPEGFELRIGRSGKYNNIVLPESFVSSSHGRLFQDRGRFFYQDGHSSNGSYVTSSTRTKYLKETDQVVPLSHNSVIRIGSMKDPNKRVILWFTYMAAGEAPPVRIQNARRHFPAGAGLRHSGCREHQRGPDQRGQDAPAAHAAG